MAIVGYARVSTQSQDLTAQIEALKAAGAGPIYKEKISGVRADRPQLARLMAKLMPGDFRSNEVAPTANDRGPFPVSVPKPSGAMRWNGGVGDFGPGKPTSIEPP
jgi:hypothetical protein